MYTHLSDNKKQDSSTIRCHIEHVSNDLDEKREMPCQMLQAIYNIVDRCAVNYWCGVVLYVLTMISYSLKVLNIRCVQAPGHGKEEVDGLIGIEKTYADTIFCKAGMTS